MSEHYRTACAAPTRHKPARGPSTHSLRSNFETLRSLEREAAENPELVGNLMSGYTELAEAGHHDAQMALARVLREGNLVPRDLERAKFWEWQAIGTALEDLYHSRDAD